MNKEGIFAAFAVACVMGLGATYNNCSTQSQFAWFSVNRGDANVPAKIDVDPTTGMTDNTWEQVVQETDVKLDIIIAMDNSGSMSEEVAAAGQAMGALISSLEDMGVKDVCLAATLGLWGVEGFTGKLHTTVNDEMGNPKYVFCSQHYPNLQALAEAFVPVMVRQRGDFRVVDQGEATLAQAHDIITNFADFQSQGLFGPKSALALVLIGDENDLLTPPAGTINCSGGRSYTFLPRLEDRRFAGQSAPLPMAVVPDGGCREAPFTAEQFATPVEGMPDTYRMHSDIDTAFADILKVMSPLPTVFASLAYQKEDAVPAGGENEEMLGVNQVVRELQGVTSSLLTAQAAAETGDYTELRNNFKDLGSKVGKAVKRQSVFDTTARICPGTEKVLINGKPLSRLQYLVDHAASPSGSRVTIGASTIGETQTGDLIVISFLPASHPDCPAN